LEERDLEFERPLLGHTVRVAGGHRVVVVVVVIVLSRVLLLLSTVSPTPRTLPEGRSRILRA